VKSRGYHEAQVFYKKNDHIFNNINIIYSHFNLHGIDAGKELLQVVKSLFHEMVEGFKIL